MPSKSKLLLRGSLQRRGFCRGLPTRFKLPLTLLVLFSLTSLGYYSVLMWNEMLEKSWDRFDVAESAAKWGLENQMKLSHFIMNRPSLPSKTTFYIAIVVPSRPQDFAWRSAIRSSWGKKTKSRHKPSVVVIFVIGTCPDLYLASAQQSIDLAGAPVNQSCYPHALETEVSLHNDILQIRLTDNYEHLTQKLNFAFRFLYHFVSLRYVLKCDQDTFVNLNLLNTVILDSLKKAPTSDTESVPEIMLGYRVTNDVPLRPKVGQAARGFEVDTETFPEDQYPAYLQGNAYLFDGRKLSLLSRRCPQIFHPISKEDAYFTGICRAAVEPSEAVPLLTNYNFFIIHFNSTFLTDDANLSNENSQELCLIQERYVTVIDILSPEALFKLWSVISFINC